MLTAETPGLDGLSSPAHAERTTSMVRVVLEDALGRPAPGGVLMIAPDNTKPVMVMPLADGTFETTVPNGKIVLEAFHARAGHGTAEIVLPKGDVLSILMRLDGQNSTVTMLAEAGSTGLSTQAPDGLVIVGVGDCCSDNGTPGCEDDACEAAVCAADPFCCDETWDGICADQAFLLCPDICITEPPGEICDGTEIPEGEDNCGLPDDIVNGGCNAAAPVFTPIACGETYCGTVAFDDVAGLRDTDWYAFDVPPGGGVYTWTVSVNFSGLVGFVDTNDCATASAVDPAAFPLAGETVSVSRCFSEGTWWAFVASDFSAPLPCDSTSQYTATLTCEGPCPIGACCFSDGSCAEMSIADCAANGGDYQGDGTDCEGANCIAICGPGAGDCFGNNGTPGCEDVDCCNLVCSLDSFCCDVTWDSICADIALANCEGAPSEGACCFPDGSCQFLTIADCEAQGGDHQGLGVLCENAFCPVAPTNDLCADAILVGVPSVTLGTTDGATVDDDFPFCGTAITSPGVWYLVEGNGNTLTATTCGALFDYDTKISVYCACDDPTCVDGNDDNCSDGASGLLSTVTWCSQVGATYAVLVHGFGGGTGTFELQILDGASCGGAIECVPPVPTGACCFPDGSCDILSEEECIAAGGEYQGDDVACFGPGAVVEYSDAPGLAIPDGDAAGLSTSIMVPDSFVIGDLDVSLSITHTFLGDLCVTLEHNGVSVDLVQRPGGFVAGDPCHFGSPFGCSSDNYAGAILDDEGLGGSIEAACDADLTSPPGYTPNNPLSAFDGMDAAGMWTITVSDNAAADTGTFEAWSLLFGEPGEPICPQEIEGELDIKPGSCPNSFNTKSKGVLPVALVGTGEFDVTEVDVSTVVLSRADGVGGSVAALSGPPGPGATLEDTATPFDGDLCDCHELHGDGIMDLNFKFSSYDVSSVLELGGGMANDQVELVLSGLLLDGTAFVASDCLRLVPGSFQGLGD
jgi:subtilisin-like proprotein convertase family protein